MIDKKNDICQLIYPSCPFDFCIEKKEEEKCTHYYDLKFKIKVIPVIIGALGIDSNELKKWIEKWS